MNEGQNVVLETVSKKRDKQDARNEQRSLRSIGDIEDHIKKELLQRLKKGVYEDIYNFSQKNFEAALKEHREIEGIEDEEDEYVEEYDDDEEEEEENSDDADEMEDDDDEERDIEDSATGEQEYEFEDGGDEFEELLHDEDDSQDEDDDGDEEDDEEEDIQRFKTPLSVNTVSALKKRAKPTGGRSSLLPKAKKPRANVVIQYENEFESSSSRPREIN